MFAQSPRMTRATQSGESRPIRASATRVGLPLNSLNASDRLVMATESVTSTFSKARATAGAARATRRRASWFAAATADWCDVSTSSMSVSAASPVSPSHTADSAASTLAGGGVVGSRSTPSSPGSAASPSSMNVSESSLHSCASGIDMTSRT